MMVVIMIMIVVIPIVIRAPAVAVLIPPAMAMFPTPGARFRQFVAVLRGLRAVPTMMLGGFVKLVVCPGDALLAVVICVQWGGAGEKQSGGQSRPGKNCAKTPGVQWKLHRFSLVAAAEIACGEKFGKKTGAYSMEV